MSIESIVKRLQESRLNESESYISVEYTYNGDGTSDYLGHVRVMTQDEDTALEAARMYANEKHLELEPRHFVITNDNYTNTDIIDEEGELITSQVNEAEEEEDDNASYEKFKEACMSNPTWKKINSICKKNGYKLGATSCVEVRPSGRKIIDLSIVADGTDSYSPEIFFYNGKFGTEDPQFEIQTTAYGALSIEEHLKFIEAVTAAHSMIVAINKIDLMTLHQYKSDY